MKHKHYEVIRAWSEGTPIQYRVILKDDTRSPWVDLSEYSFDKRSPNFDAENVEWRIKPLEYRIALIYDEYVKDFVTHIYSDPRFNDNIEKRPGFIKWISDWTEVDLNES